MEQYARYIAIAILVIFPILVALSGVLYWQLRKKKKRLDEIHSTRRIKAEDIRIKKKEIAPRRRHTLDSTKRKSLQPGNKNLIPQGWESIEAKQPASVLIDIVPTPKGAVQYKFFGSALCMQDKVLLQGLDKKLHKLEITDENILYVDNEERKIHIDDIKMLKRYILEVQGKA